MLYTNLLQVQRFHSLAGLYHIYIEIKSLYHKFLDAMRKYVYLRMNVAKKEQLTSHCLYTYMNNLTHHFQHVTFTLID